MNLINAIIEGLIVVIQWIKMVYEGFCDWIGISEWAVLFMALGIISLLIFGITKAINKWR